MTLAVLLQYRTRRPWAPAPSTLRRWARLAAGRRRGELGIRVVGSRESRALNQRWRGRAQPTNVL
jgi:probable rRNA maturation factor